MATKSLPPLLSPRATSPPERLATPPTILQGASRSGGGSLAPLSPFSHSLTPLSSLGPLGPHNALSPLAALRGSGTDLPSSPNAALASITNRISVASGLQATTSAALASPHPARISAAGATGLLASAAAAAAAAAGTATAAGSPAGAAGASASPRGGAGGGGGPSARVDSGPRKPTQSQLCERLHAQLLEVLRTEWRSIRSSNLGVLSGTAVVEELLLRRIQSWAAELHLLAITHRSAAERLGALCRGMGAEELQQLLVMLDQTGHPELSDFVRLVVFNTADPAAKGVVGDLRALRAAHGGRRARSTPSNRRRAPSTQLSSARPFSHLLSSGPPDDPASLRFAGLLPEGHRLVAGARAVAERRRQQEEEQRRAAEARAEARARARAEAAAGSGEDAEAERRPSDASARHSVLHGRGAPPDILPYFMADVEEQWRRTVGTRVPAEGVSDTCILLSEPLPTYEAPPDVALMRREAEEAAMAPQPGPPGPTRGHAYHGPPSRGGSIASMRNLPFTPGAPGRPAGGGGGGGVAPWGGGPAASASSSSVGSHTFHRLTTTARPG
ncbi:hypothetical protein Agub_g1796, partial [Astrephomene gubernaculifera]